MPDYHEIYVIRHGQTSWNVAGRHQGRLDSPLTGKGRAQAAAMGRVLAASLPEPARFAAFSSPQGRARATAALVFAGLGLVAAPDMRLGEVAFGKWEGLTWDDIAARWPERAAMAETEPFLWHFQAPGGETLASLQARMTGFLDELSGPAIIVTHGVAGRVLRGLWLGLDDGGMAGLPGGQGVIFHLSPEHGHRVIGAGL